MFNKRMASKSAAQILADLRVSNEKMSSHLDGELALELKLTLEVDKVRQRIALAQKQIDDYKVKEQRLTSDRRELEEDYFIQLDAVKKINESISGLKEELTTGKRMFRELYNMLDRSRRQYLRTESELKHANAELRTIQDEAITVARRPITQHTQTEVDTVAIRDLDFILNDCEEQRKTINRIRASLSALASTQIMHPYY